MSRLQKTRSVSKVELSQSLQNTIFNDESIKIYSQQAF
jgi:hypothetical protein